MALPSTIEPHCPEKRKQPEGLRKQCCLGHWGYQKGAVTVALTPTLFSQGGKTLGQTANFQKQEIGVSPGFA
jgi:hypothetical protein